VEAALAPAVGGSLAALRFAGVDLLRRAPSGSTDPLAMASFPLVPYANRIAEGRFRFGGQDFRLPLNFGDHPHSIHGLGWTAPWTVEAVTEDTAQLVHPHAGGHGWRWAYQAEQRVAVAADAVEMTLSVHNLSKEIMPVGLGFHPYLQADEATVLQFDAASLWLSTPDMLPDREVAADTLGNWAAGDSVMGESLIDNVYSEWSGSATVVRGDGTRLALTASGAPWLHVYRPPHSYDFCLEPVSHIPDAINRPQGMDRLEPGGSKTLSMRIAIDKSDQTLPKPSKIA
jgi:aldose 1-epimerase